MNVLVHALEREPGRIDELALGDEVGFDGLASVAHLDKTLERLFRAAGADEFLARVMHRAGLEVLSRREWREALRQAGRLRPVRAPEWVTFVRGHGDLGLALPDDSSKIRRLALLSEIDGAVRRVSVDEVRNSPVAISLSTSSGHCGFPRRAVCDSGVCGDCALRTRGVGHQGLVCWCPHQP